VRDLVQELIGWLKAPEQASLRRSFAVWIRRVLLPALLPGQALPKVTDLLEVDTMLAERVKAWTREWKQEGLQEGRLEGRQEGKQEGLATVLIHLMHQKFGELDQQTLRRVHSADAEQLLVWSKRILSANSIEEIFQTT